MAEYSPMMQHYLDTKEQYKDCILFYRLGDFYEMFFDDAITASRELELTLTGKDCGQEERAPMCGIPFHAAEVYISRLIGKGYKTGKICRNEGQEPLAQYDSAFALLLSADAYRHPQLRGMHQYVQRAEEPQARRMAPVLRLYPCTSLRQGAHSLW